MGFWPFGKSATVESVSRIVNTKLDDGRQVRGRLAVHFAKPVKEDAAEECGNRLQIEAEKLLRDQKEHEKVIGAEGRLSAELLGVYPKDLPEPRVVELAALHVVGDVGLSDSLRRKTSDSGLLRAVKPETTPTPLPAQLSSSSPPNRRRSSSSSMRSMSSLLLPPGSPPPAIAAFIAPLALETAARLLIGTLRAHDLIAVRKVTIDPASADVFASLVSASEAPPGGYDVARAAEIARWTKTLGEEAIAKLRLAANEVSAHLALAQMLATGVPPGLAADVVSALASTTFTDQKPTAAALEELAPVPFEEAARVMAERASRVLEGHDDLGPLTSALAPLFSPIVQDMKIAAEIVRHAVPSEKPSSPGTSGERGSSASTTSEARSSSASSTSEKKPISGPVAREGSGSGERVPSPDEAE